MTRKKRAETNGMSIASLIFAIIALITSPITVFTPMMVGLSLTFALLSRGRYKMCATAVIAVLLCLIALIISFIFSYVIYSSLVYDAQRILGQFSFYGGV